MKGWLIKRLSDGKFYAGTMDRETRWTDEAHAARFTQIQEAQRRMKGMKAEDDLEVVPA